MNTAKELVEKYDIKEKTAERMIRTYQNHIGQRNGIYEITDMTYIGNREKDIELTCTSCNNVIHKRLKRSRWDELQKHCFCEKENRDSENFPKIKKAIRNDDKSYLGKVYGTLKVIDFEYYKTKKSGHKINWVCECKECKETKICIPSQLKNNKYKCVCQRSIEPLERDKYIGKKFNRLTIVDFHTQESSTGKSKQLYADCICECGNKYKTQWTFIKNNTVKSCGCYFAELRETEKQAYHKTSSPLYKTWNSMKQRCNNPNADKNKRYYYRGIKVCEEWQNSFEAFEKWSFENGYRPNEGLSIDRIDANKGYSPDNCRWTSIFVQSVNKGIPAHKSNNHAKYYTINGETKNRKEWCKEFDISEAVVRYREKVNGMSFEEALKLEKRTKGNHLAHLNLPYAKSNDINRLNKCSSYIEANLYMAFIRLNSEFELFPNEHIGKYVVDFLEKRTKTIIECDGYDYHKSKEQVDSDCKRERQLIALGYKVIRFSGIEINNDADDCAKQLIDILVQNKGVAL